MDLFNSPKFRSRVEELMLQEHVPGLAMAVVQGEATASVAFGKASLEKSQPCTADTLFDIASSSKSMTAASVGLLVNGEKHPEVQFEALMSDLLPDDFVIAEKGYTESITVEDILSHRTGMAPHDDSYLGLQALRPDDARSVTRNLRNLQVAAPIRTKYLYCNMMYTVATHLVEEKTKAPFSDFLQTQFFRPLGMESSNLQPQAARDKGLGDRISTGYSWDKREENYKDGFQAPDAPEAQGAGSIMTSANDYIKWVKALVNQEGPITEAVYKGLIKPRNFENPDAEDLTPFSSPKVYASGLEVFYYRGHQVIGHDGAIPGFGSGFFFLPGYNFGGVVIGNSEGAGTVSEAVKFALIDEVIGLPDGERLDWNKVISDLNAQTAEPEPEDERETARQELCPGIKEPQTQTTPLEAYTGTYSHPGYHSMSVEIRDEELFIDATDRSFGFTLTFEHVCDETKYVAHLSDVFEGGDTPLRAEFVLEGGRAVKMGIHLEAELEEYIWFARV